MAEPIARTFPLLGTAAAATAAVRTLDGVLGIEATGSPTRLRITYDVERTDYGILQRRLAEAGFAAPGGRWQRLRAGWYRFQDENLRANARHHPACCSKPPPGAGRR